MKKIALALAATMALSVTGAMAQDKLEGTIGADIVSRYYWRGQALGDGAIQPTLGLSWKGLSLTVWGSYGFVDTEDAKEFDLTLAYAIKGFHIGVTDYWFDRGTDFDGNEISDAKYFKYGTHGTTHVFEANIGYDFGPVALNWYTNFAGNDGVNKDGDRAYSSYVEATAPFKLAGLDWTAAVGAVPYRTSFYSDADGFAVTNVSVRATKDIKVTDKFAVPVFAQVAANPSNEKAYFLVGFTLQP